MSIHSFRNIGFSFTASEETCRKWRTLFTGFYPEDAVRALQLSAEDPYVYISYFEHLYRLRTTDGVLEKKGSEGPERVKTIAVSDANEEAPSDWTDQLYMNEALVLYHVLGDIKENPIRSGVMIPEAELDPVRIRSSNRTDPLLKSFAKTYSGQLELLNKSCESCGAKRLSKGDAGWEFYPFPQIPVQLIFWEADEDFEASVQVLVDKNTTDYMHFEAIGCMVADLFELIDRKAKI
ncbi:MAG: DUF3786 domain-containing protein [Blautia sp.]|nr:DUF3786 domain-containing protein [Blautia sp.]